MDGWIYEEIHTLSIIYAVGARTSFLFPSSSSRRRRHTDIKEARGK